MRFMREYFYKGPNHYPPIHFHLNFVQFYPRKILHANHMNVLKFLVFGTEIQQIKTVIKEKEQKIKIGEQNNYSTFLILNLEHLEIERKIACKDFCNHFSHFKFTSVSQI